METQRPIDEGRPFGDVGAYELLTGRAHFAVDPEEPASAAVADLDLAPRDADGRVRFSADFYLVRPVDASRARGSILIDVANRGGRVLPVLNNAALLRSPARGEAGDGFLMRHGFVMAGVGWQADVAEEEGRLNLHVPRASGANEPVEGLVRADFVPDADNLTTMPLGHWGHIPHPVAASDDLRNVLTVRDRPDGERQVVPRDRWRFARDADGEVLPDAGHVYLEDGFERARIYELVYVAHDPPVSGLGFLALRDFADYLVDDPDSPVRANRAIAFGGSQSARVLREMTHAGLLRSLHTGLAIDGVFAFVGGAGMGSFNHRFAQPSRGAGAYDGFLYPIDRFPFAARALVDPHTGALDGLLSRYDGQRPKLVQVSSSVEYWSRGGSLLHTDPASGADIELAADERVYLVASSQHFEVGVPPPSEVANRFARIGCRYPMNPSNKFWIARALLLALDRWVAEGHEPPPSVVPTRAAGQLVTPERLAFPELPGLRIPMHAYHPRALDRGAGFPSHGIITKEPPEVGGSYPVAVPAVDADGNEIAGIRMPEVAVPLATYTGWNWRHPDRGAADQLCEIAGAVFPFAVRAEDATREEDPRPSIEERYRDRSDYLQRYRQATAQLVEGGYLLAEDIEDIVTRGGILWDWVHDRREDR